MGAGQKRPRPESSKGDDVDGSGSGSGFRSGVAPPIATSDPPAPDMSIFRPPVLRSAALTVAATLNKALFTRTFDVAAARVQDARLIAKYQKALATTRELLRLDRVSSVVDDPEQPASSATQLPAKPPPRRKCLLLQPTISPTAPDTWSDVLKQAVERDELGVFPYKLTLGYDYWTSRDILVSVLPEEFHDDIPTGFNTAGHVAHLNLRDRFKPYKYVVAQVLLDKNPQLRTVINKTDLVGTASAFRTFRYEVLAGPDDLNVEVRENLCTYRFDYSKVYWNSKLEPEHTRLLGLFRPGEVVADVMAGIGPFAVPAGKRGVFVWANDMNPDSYDALCQAVARNKVAAYVRASNEDGRVFIRPAVTDVLASKAQTNAKSSAAARPPPSSSSSHKDKPRRRDDKAGVVRPTVPVPPVIAHFVMNLPASALTFLPHFRGLYAGCEELFTPSTQKDNNDESGTATEAGTSGTAAARATFPFPMVHAHCFAPKNEDNPALSLDEVCARVSAELGVPMTLCAHYADAEQQQQQQPPQGVPLPPSQTDGSSAGTTTAPPTPTPPPTHLLYVHNVRAVAPHKSMFCASFRLPASQFSLRSSRPLRNPCVRLCFLDS
ncbi:tRNA methyltransferase trm5 [Niveomyces insectorum RCEF 264]|uniref:tRNA (guanine(37)-N1)-methyltransferase n=1 Tax=Niveomyces insectorum RCEF 264 TaxID=1081102 RepID=A0A167X2D3_9HYPO|nr:tRNA methyltransferase trm5 [Niveomyces insectorum RCEF 264]